MVSGRSLFNKYRKIISRITYYFSLCGKDFNKYMLIKCRNVTGRKGLLLRYIAIKNLTHSCGDNVSVHPGVYLYNIEKLSLGSNISIHPMCYIDALGGIRIGDNVSIAHRSSILSTNHTWDDASIPIKYNRIIQKETIIEDDVWIGCDSKILAGVHINSRSVIAAGAVVNKNIPKNTLAAGIPAKFLKPVN